MEARSRTAPLGHRSSALAEALARVGDRWSLLLVEALLGGPCRFSGLLEDVGIAPNILSQRLKHLERQGILMARPYSDRPPRAVYELTASGRELAGSLRLLAHWGAARSGSSETIRHAACGTPVEARWYCATCARSIETPEDPELRFL